MTDAQGDAERALAEARSDAINGHALIHSAYAAAVLPEKKRRDLIDKRWRQWLASLDVLIEAAQRVARTGAPRR